MSNNYDKVVKMACKPKNANPKAKYVDVLISATYSEDGSLNDIIRHLSLRLREPNAVVVFKALLVLHQMIRSGSTDQLLEHLSMGDSLRLRNVGGSGHWEGYSPPSSLGAYAQYLDTRIKVWRDLRHDLVKVQTESNKRSDGLGAGSKARRLRHLPVDKGLLKEVKGVQQILDSLILCKFYDDDLRDENTVLAFRMLVKDLLVLFQAGNEGVCNILEHYFEMSKPDATESFEIYKSFIKQTDKVVDYLGVARKLHNVVNVPVPNLKHAPTSLVKALEEYLNDPNFEENRREYRASLGVVEGRSTNRSPSPAAPKDKPATESKENGERGLVDAPEPSTSTAPVPPLPAGVNQRIQDFFDSIQADHQPTMFGGPAQPFPQQAQLQMQAPFNPFRQSMMPQQTGFMPTQMTGFPQGGPFVQPQMTGQMAFGGAHQQNMFGQSGMPFMPSQQTGFPQPQQHAPQMGAGAFSTQPTSFQPSQGVQSQQTGSNPFRQSTMPLSMGHPSGGMSQPTSPFMNQHQIPRPGSTPALSSMAQSSSPPPAGSDSAGQKNPFAPAPGSQPAPKPQESRGPSMNELVWNRAQGIGAMSNTTSQPTGGSSPWSNLNGGSQAPTGSSSPWSSLNGRTSSPPVSTSTGPTGISDIASSFAVDPSKSSSNDFMSQFGSLSVNTTSNSGTTSPPPPSQFGSVSSNPTGSTSTSPSSGGGFMQPQPTAYGGSAVKRFQPTSSFGSQLMESLSPIREPTPTNATSNGAGPSPPSTSPPPTQPFQPSQPTQPTQQPNNAFPMAGQQTGMPNPFRQSNMFGSNPAPTGNMGGGGSFGVGGQNPSGQGFGGGMGAFGQFGGFGQNSQQQQQQQQQQQSGGSLI